MLLFAFHVDCHFPGAELVNIIILLDYSLSYIKLINFC